MHRRVRQPWQRWRQYGTGEAPVTVTPRLRHLAGGLAWTLIAAGLFLDLATPPTLTPSAFFAAAPLIVAPFLSAGLTLLVSVVSTAIHSVVVIFRDAFSLADGVMRSVNVATVAALALGINAYARRGGRELASVRGVAEAAQRALLPMPPARIGDLVIAARYVAAHAEAQLGGDLYAVQETRHGTRILVGDVRGKGLDAVEALAVVIGSFRETAEREEDLIGVGRRLEAALNREARRRESQGNAISENFMTAVLAEVPAGRPDLLRLVNRGHPAPLLYLTDGSIRALPPGEHALPLGLAHLMAPPDRTDEIAFPPGAILLFYTDGVSEARNREGVFYDVEHQLRGWRVSEPGDLLDALIADVTAHTGGAVTDDMALLAVGRLPTAPDARAADVVARASAGADPPATVLRTPAGPPLSASWSR